MFVVLRTSAVEAVDELPVHFHTTLACIPESNYIIYSDFEEDVEGHHVYDALDQVNAYITRSSSEFALYNHLRDRGWVGLEALAEQSMDTYYPGWKLDKWKVLPMIDKALRRKREASWFVFIETDTYMLWGNMLEYLSKFDPSQPQYLGMHMHIDGVLFGHGGSGFALSNPAMQRLAKHWRENEREFEMYSQMDWSSQDEWASDMVLGKAVKDVGINMFWSYPHLQGESLTTIDWNVSKINREPWCYAPLTFHGMGPDEFELLWQFEQDWRRRHPDGDSPRFRDIFKGVVHPKIRSRQPDWDNISSGTEYSEETLAIITYEERLALSKAETEAHLSFEKCRTVCESSSSCIQFSHTEGRCLISDELRLGRPTSTQSTEDSDEEGKCTTVQSGWVMSRVSDYVKDLDLLCEALMGKDWIV